MACINNCGTKYLKELHADFDIKLTKYNKELDQLL